MKFNVLKMAVPAMWWNSELNKIWGPIRLCNPTLRQAHIGTPLPGLTNLGFQVIIDEYPNLTGTALMMMQIYTELAFHPNFYGFFYWKITNVSTQTW